MPVRLLDPTLINQIAAGEVIERPASAIKELVENAIDAGATKIDVAVRDGGKKAIVVTDNGYGMTADDLTMAVERHATSKIPDNNLFDIKSLGFRGEALPSIGSVSRLTITTRTQSSDTAWQLNLEGGVKSLPQPASAPLGTRIEVHDLFFATPARLKFLKSATTESNHIQDHLNRLALAYPKIQFSFKTDDKKVFQYTTADNRYADVLGKEFAENTCLVDADYQSMSLRGAISVPTYNRGNAQEQYFFVNGRPVKDKLMTTAVRIAYQDFLASDRYPSVVLFLNLPPEDVDINVHPAKAEVRFRDTQTVRGFLINAIRQVLQSEGGRASTTLSTSAVKSFSAPTMPHRALPGFTAPSSMPRPSYAPTQHIYAPSNYTGQSLAESAPMEPASVPTTSLPEHFGLLGQAKAQIHDTYIVSETQDQLILVDQHAAHERLVYERLKDQLAHNGIHRQALLIPEVVHLNSKELAALKDHMDDLATWGLVLETFGDQSVVVREVPVLIADADIKQLVRDLAHELEESQTAHGITEKIHEVLATYGCHHSVRSGRKLSLDEMNALLRQMEDTPHSGQCNHGRPTYITLHKKDIERLFGRG